MYAQTGLRACAAVLVLTGSVVVAQPAPSQDQEMSIDQRIDALRQEFESKLKQRDDEIAALKKQVATSPSSSADHQATADQTTKDILRDLESRDRGPLTIRTPANFNPNIAVVSDFRGSISTDNANPARNRFDIGSIELDFRAAVAPIADAVAVLPLEREVEDPLFFVKSDDSEAAEVESGIDIEEGYLFLHDFGVPNLTAKLGRFHLRFGRQNILHTHDWPTFDNNFVNKSFLGEESLADAGLSLSYVIPPAWIGGEYVEVIAEVVTGEGLGEPTPVLNNSGSVDSPALNTHVLWNHDLTSDWNMELGASFLTAKHNDDNQQNANLFGVDATLIRSDPTGGFNNSLIQFEGIYGAVDTSRDDTEYAMGFYALAQQQLNRDWYAGVRVDWTQNALDAAQEVWGVSPYVTWYYFEFLRFRLQYQHKDGDVTPEDTLFFQATWIFGAHPPHPYWAMK